MDRNQGVKSKGRKVRAPAEGPSAEADFVALKAGGIIRQRQKDRYTMRLKCPGGRLPLERLARILEVAHRYGGDHVHLSARQSIEIPYVSLSDTDRVRRSLAEVGQEIASCGARVRVPTACAGCELNPLGLVDTQRMARLACDRFFGQGPLPHKFKMAFSGCPNDCPHTSTNDLGFQGAVEPELDEGACTQCGLCVAACKEGAIRQDSATSTPRWIPEKCLYCGDCVRACPVDAWRARRTGWMVRVGGKHGRHPITGATVAEFLPDEKVLETIEAVLAWYRKFGQGKGRVRLGALLLEPRTWRQFVADLAPVLGQWAVRNPSPPRPNEIHLMKSGA